MLGFAIMIVGIMLAGAALKTVYRDGEHPWLAAGAFIFVMVLLFSFLSDFRY